MRFVRWQTFGKQTFGKRLRNIKMIGFWLAKDRALRSSTQGLTQEQIEFLQSLKVGDRLVLFPAKPDANKNYPDLSLTKVENKQQDIIDLLF